MAAPNYQKFQLMLVLHVNLIRLSLNLIGSRNSVSPTNLRCFYNPSNKLVLGRKPFFSKGPESSCCSLSQNVQPKREFTLDALFGPLDIYSTFSVVHLTD